MDAEGLTVATWNTRKSELGPVRAFVDVARPDVLVLTESRRLSNDDLDAIGATGATWRGDHTDAGVGIYPGSTALVSGVHGSRPPKRPPDLGEC